MIKPLATASALALASCLPHWQPPPPLFTPRPPYPPEPVDPGRFDTGGSAELWESDDAFIPHDPPPADDGQAGIAPATPPSNGEYPTARRSTQADEVISPYPPHHRIDVTGFKPGDLARDPWNQKIFRIP